MAAGGQPYIEVRFHGEIFDVKNKTEKAMVLLNIRYKRKKIVFLKINLVIFVRLKKIFIIRS